MSAIKIKRSEFASFLNIAPGETTASWARMGKGITGQTLAYNPSAESEQYIDEDSAQTFINAYNVSMQTPQTAFKGDSVFDFVDGLRQARAIGSAAETECLLVYIYDYTEQSSTKHYKAEKCKCTIGIEEFGGDAGDSVQLSYTVYMNGDPVACTVTITGGVPSIDS